MSGTNSDRTSSQGWVRFAHRLSRSNKGLSVPTSPHLPGREQGSGHLRNDEQPQMNPKTGFSKLPSASPEPLNSLEESLVKGDSAPAPIRLGTEQPPSEVETTTLWGRALRSLPSSEQKRLRAVAPRFNTGGETLSELQRLAYDTKQEIERSTWTATTPTRAAIAKIITCLRRFKEVGDIAVNFDPMHAALPWAVFRFLLEAATIATKEAEALIVGLERVAFLSLRCSVYEKLYLSGSRKAAIGHDAASLLERALILLYIELLLLLASVRKQLTRSTPINTVGALFNPQVVSDQLQTIKDLAEQVEVEASNCERCLRSASHELRIAELERLRKAVDEESIRADAKIERLWVRTSEEDRGRILRWISPIHYASDHEFARQNRVGTTGAWLLENSAFKEWKQSDVSEIFWLHGIRGAGKTKLSSKVVDNAISSVREGVEREAVVYFYCDRNRDDHKDPASVLRSLIRQLSADRLGENDVNVVIEETWRRELRSGFPSEEFDLQMCKSLLPKLVAAHRKTVMVVDGFDECDERSRHELIQSLDELFQNAACCVKIFIASRNDPDLVENYISRTHLQVEASHNRDDIQEYVLARLSETRNIYFREKMPAEVKENILQTFDAKSDGMFQWAVLHMDELLQLKRTADVTAYLGSLPKGLRRAYLQVMQTINSQEGSAPIIAARAFRWIMSAWRPLAPEELIVAVCQTPSDFSDPDPDIDINFVMGRCRNLVVVAPSSASAQEADDMICRFSHLSVQEYLEDYDWDNKPDTSLPGVVCLQFLMTPEPAPDAARFRRYADHWYHHFLECDADEASSHSDSSSRIQDLRPNLLAEFLGEVANSSIHYRRWVAQLPPSWRAWDHITRQHLQPSGFAAYGAVALRLQATIDGWLRNHILDPSLHSTEGGSLVRTAVVSGNIALCMSLIRRGADAGEVGPTGKTLLIEALLGDHPTLVRFLISECKVDVNSGRDHAGLQPLCVAIGQNRPEMVQLLLEAGADPNAHGSTVPAMHAALKHDESCAKVLVRLLLDNGADTNLDSGPKWRRPLAAAVWADQASVATMLVQHGANIHAGRPLYRYFRHPNIFEVHRVKSHVDGDDDSVPGKRMASLLVEAGALDYVKGLKPEEQIDEDVDFGNFVAWFAAEWRSFRQHIPDGKRDTSSQTTQSLV